MSHKREYNRKRQQAYRAYCKQNGLCSDCGIELDRKGARCKKCVKKQRERAHVRCQARNKAGLCYRCNNTIANDAYDINPEIVYRLCHVCYFKGMAQTHTNTSKNWKALKNLFDLQGGCCNYTGEPLILGGNASLDHILPKSRGGADHPDNFQWVTRTINNTKRNLTHAEFIALCKSVTENH